MSEVIEAQLSAPGRSVNAAVPIATPSVIQMSKACMEGVIGAMRDLQEGVPKDGQNKHDKYSYIKADDVMAAVQPVFVKNRINVHQREVARTIVQNVLCIHYHFDVSHGDGEVMMNVGAMTGMCRWQFAKGTVDDKAGSKCFTSAMKYFLINYFKIPTEDSVRTDPDDRGADEDINDYDRRSRGREPDSAGRDYERRSSQRDYDDGGSRETAGQRHGDRRDPPDNRWGPPDERPTSTSSSPPDEPPPEDPPSGNGQGELPDLRTRVVKLKKFLETAVNEDGAFDIWHNHADLLRSIPRTTYDYLRDAYQSRWNIYPPVLNPARGDE